MNVSFLQELLNTVAEQGRALLPKALFGTGPEENVQELAKALMSGRGEASGVAIARQLLNRYRHLSADDRRAFFRFLGDSLHPPLDAVAEAASAFAADPSEAALVRLQEAVASPREEFFRRLNLAPGATAEIVAMRRDLLRLPREDKFVTAVDADLRKLLSSWFNRGFLVLKRIDWQTPAAILERVIAYEAVHEIKGWDDLRRRLDPHDRRCYGFFHPSLIDDPLIFVEVALTHEIPDAIAPMLQRERADPAGPEPTTAVFYSISNCQEGLKGITFGNFLLKQVVEDLAREKPSLKTFVTLSPVPTFARWLDRAVADDTSGIVTPDDRKALQRLKDPSWSEDGEEKAALEETLLAMVAQYFLVAKNADARPVDPVARFHLGNGARLERINWLGDTSEKGLREAHGLMVNFRYDLREIERNHEAFANHGTVAAARAVKSLLRPQPKPSKQKDGQKLLAAPAKEDELPLQS